MAKIKFTNPALKSLETGEWYWDSVRAGLAARRGSDDAISFSVKYRFAAGPNRGKVRRKKIGDFTGEAGGMSIDDARRLAGDVIEAALRGEDILDERKADTDIESFGDAFLKYLDEHAGKWSEGHHHASKRRFEMYLQPLAGLALSDVRRSDINPALTAISAKVQRNRTATLLVSFFRWAVDDGLVDTSPAEGIKKARTPETPRNRTLIDQIADDIGEPDDSDLIAFLAACDASGDIGRFAKFLLLTGARVEEAAGMTTDEVNRERMLWTIKPERNKSRRVYYNVVTQAALDLLPDVEEGLVWKGERGGKLLANPHRAIETLRSTAGIEKFGFHDLRRTLVTWLQRAGCDKALRDAVTNHKVTSGADASYAHAQRLKEQREFLEKWAAFVGKHSPECDIEAGDSNVMPLRSA